MHVPIFQNCKRRIGFFYFRRINGKDITDRNTKKRGAMREKILMRTLIAWVFIGFVLVNSSYATTYYVRTDGGTTTQCTGTTDAPYPGSGTGQVCAFNHPFWVISTSGAPTKMSGGDTLIIGPGEYMMGFGAPNTAACSKSFPWACHMRSVPSGSDASHPTRILGKGWDTGCTNRPQLWGTERAADIIELKGSSNVEIQCLDVTDHSSCMEFGPDIATLCNRNTYPFGPWASFGIAASDSKNVLLKNVSVHGLHSGIVAGRLTDWTLENVDILRNSFVGWDGDIGATVSSNSGTITFNNVKIQFSGCGEIYPYLQPHHCYSQDQGGYGDGLGTAKTGANWVLINSNISHNVSDGLDLLYHDGSGTVTIKQSRFEGNAGNQVKIAAPAVIENSILVGNCAYFKDQPFTSTTSTSFQSTAFNNCRAGGDPLHLAFHPSMTATVYNSTITSNGDTIVSSVGSSCNGTEKITSRNNIYLGGAEFNTAGADIADLYYAAGAGGNGDGPCGNIPFDDDYSIIWGTKFLKTDCAGLHSKCQDPQLVGPIVKYYNGNEYNLYLQSSSPARNAATILSGVAAVDFNGYDRGSQWDIGALEYGSVPTTPTTSLSLASPGSSSSTTSGSLSTSLASSSTSSSSTTTSSTSTTTSPVSGSSTTGTISTSSGTLSGTGTSSPGSGSSIGSSSGSGSSSPTPGSSTGSAITSPSLISTTSGTGTSSSGTSTSSSTSTTSAPKTTTSSTPSSGGTTSSGSSSATSVSTPTQVASPTPVASPIPVASPTPAVSRTPVSLPVPVVPLAPVASPIPVASPTPVASPAPVAPSTQTTSLTSQLGKTSSPKGSSSSTSAVLPTVVASPTPAASARPVAPQIPVASPTQVASSTPNLNRPSSSGSTASSSTAVTSPIAVASPTNVASPNPVTPPIPVAPPAPVASPEQTVTLAQANLSRRMTTTASQATSQTQIALDTSETLGTTSESKTIAEQDKTQGGGISATTIRTKEGEKRETQKLSFWDRIKRTYNNLSTKVRETIHKVFKGKKTEAHK